MEHINFDKDIQVCIDILEQGGVILYPTDTIWGLGCDATNAEAVQKIYTIKQRSESKALIVLASSQEEVLQYTVNVDLKVFDYINTTKKPTTVIYEKGENLAENLLAADGSVGIRICNDAFCKMLIEKFGKPIVSTSANISGNPAPHFFKEIDDAIKQQVDFIVAYRQDDMTPRQASAIIKWINGAIEIIRA